MNWGDKKEWAEIFETQKYRLDDWINVFESFQYPCCPFSCFSKLSRQRTSRNMCSEATSNQQSRGGKEALGAHIVSSRRTIPHRKAYDLCRLSDAVMLSCCECIHGWQLGKQLLALNQVAPLRCGQTTKFDLCRREFIVVATERLSAILPNDDTCYSGRWDTEIGSKTICERLISWRLPRYHLE
jgi:hypothetical protein